MYSNKDVILNNKFFMIQRIQSVYLILIVFINIIYVVSINNFQDINFPKISIELKQIFSFCIYIVISILLPLTSLFLYKYRNRQLILNKINILIQLIFLLIVLYNTFKNTTIISFDFFYFVVSFNIIFMILANYGIMKDENLIKSLDRFR